ncbi:hypothetical protein EGW08_016083 [Elysia chlorotica]|uniref:Ion transport domain-containing protein n=1 Tax=Elysia chlorotica TaxID=188477 RepID=A0A433T3P8_ELYCH|nr:hypothetical protein EGW08_016083 [Elysia chlorotica]
MADNLEPQMEGGQYRRPSTDASEGVIELTNLVTNPGDADGDLPPLLPGLKASESSEALNLTLHQCARDGDEYNMRILIRNLDSHVRKKINQFDEDDLTPLHYAARYNHLNVVKLLVEAGADVQAIGEDAVTPLHHAARYRREKAKKRDASNDHLDELRLDLPEEELTQGAEEDDESESRVEQDRVPELRVSNSTSLDHIEEDDTETNTQLVGTISEDESSKEESVVHYLVSRRANINAVDIYGQTPLHFAAMRGNEVACRDLLAFRGAIQIAVGDNQGITPLHSAALHNHVEIAAHAAGGRRRPDVPRQGAQHAPAPRLPGGEPRDGPAALRVRRPAQGGLGQAHRGAEVNKPRKHFMYPLHLAAMSGDVRICRLLVENQARIDAVNSDSATALHRAAALNKVEVVKFLVERGARINRKDKDNYTPLLLAATYGNTPTVELLLAKGADYSVMDKYDKTAIFMAAEENKLEVLQKLLSETKVKMLIDESDCYDNSPLHIAAQKGYLDIVQCLLKNGADLDNKNEEEETPLHLAAKHGRTNIVRELIKTDTMIVNDEDENSNTPLHLAAQYGHHKLAKVLLDLGADVSARNYNVSIIQAIWSYYPPLTVCVLSVSRNYTTTPLHLASSYGHARVVELLLDWDADVTLRDDWGRNCLGRAIENNHANVAMVIVNSSVWKDALRNAHKDPVTGRVNTPMRKLIKAMPDVAQRVFDRCMSFGQEKNPESKYFELHFDYEFLDDTYAPWITHAIKRSTDTGSEKGSSTGSSSYGGDDDELSLPPDAQPYTSDTNVLKKNSALFLMIQNERESLLAHPLVTSLLQHKWNTFGSFFYYLSFAVTSLLQHKWNTFGSFFYYLSFAVYLVFLAFLTGYMVVTDPPNTYGRNGSRIENDDCSGLDYEQNSFARIATYVIIALAGFNLLKELLQIYQAKLNYLGWTNLIEWIVYVTALLLVISFNECQRTTGYRYDWQWHLGAVAVFLAWVDLVLFIQKFPRFGIYVVMFTDILFTFSQFFIVFFLFIIAFALAFHALFQNQAPFDSVGKSLIKTSVMMIGEFDFDGIFNSDDHSVLYPAASYGIFVIFIIMMSIIIMNLLVGLAVDDIKAVQEQAALKRMAMQVGLAVDDIKAVQEQAALKRMAMQVELALDVERIIPNFIRRMVFCRRRTIRPNVMYSNPLRQLLSNSYLSPKALQRALNPEKEEIEKVKDSQEELVGQMKDLKRSLLDMREQNQKLESMLRAIVKAQDIHWQEEDYQAEDDLDEEAARDLD